MERVRSIYSGLQKLPSQCTGVVCRCMILKQLEAVGCNTWLQYRLHDVPEISPQELWAWQMGDGSGASYQHISVYVFGSDQGPDQRGSDTLIDADVEPLLYVWKFRNWCLEHILHLMVPIATKL